MRRYQRSKSGLFLMELLLNLLLFSALCGCGLLFFVKSYHLTQDTTTLHQAVRISTSMAAVYESGDGTLESLSKVFQRPAVEGSICIYYDENYAPSRRKHSRCDLFDYQPTSGTGVAYKYAERKKRRIINIFSML